MASTAIVVPDAKAGGLRKAGTAEKRQKSINAAKHVCGFAGMSGIRRGARHGEWRAFRDGSSWTSRLVLGCFLLVGMANLLKLKK